MGQGSWDTNKKYWGSTEQSWDIREKAWDRTKKSRESNSKSWIGIKNWGNATIRVLRQIKNLIAELKKNRTSRNPIRLWSQIRKVFQKV